MNILNTLRKPYFCIFLSSIILFSSCYNSSNDILSSEEINTLAMEKYVEKHISLTNELAGIFAEEKNIDINILSSSPDYFNSIDEFKTFLKDARVVKALEIANLSSEIQNNTDKFLQNLSIVNKEEINNLISAEINRQINNNLYLSKSSDICRDNWLRARERCERNFAIAIAGLAISGFFTLGLGTVIGAGVAGTVLILCGNDAANDLTECRNNQQ